MLNNLNLQSAFKLMLILLIASINSCKKDDQYEHWRVTGGSKQGIRYSSLTQIDSSNVSKLEVAWEYHTGDADTANHSQMQCNPIIVDGILYGTSPQSKLFALDAATGQQKWVFDPKSPGEKFTAFNFIMNNNRGVTYWSDEEEKQKRIFYVVGSFIHAIDAETGKLISSFGKEGRVDLHEGLGRDVSTLYVAATSPGIIFKDLLIMGSRVSEGIDAAPGHIRAYNTITGKQEWIFHTIPHPGEFGYDSWEDPKAFEFIGGANSWSGFTLDEERGILFAPTGSASFDFYGGKRRGDNLFADCLLALDAATGKRIWHFQHIHHDVWDRDLPTAPALVTVNHNGKNIDAVAQPTKTGFVFLFDRETGEPLFEIKEMPVPRETDLLDEKLSATQPIPTLPEPFTRQEFTENDLNDLISDSSFQEIRERFRKYRKGHMYTPPSKEGSIFFPGLDGGAEWGGPAFDPKTGILYVNANEMPWVITIKDIEREKLKTETYLSAGKAQYQTNCVSCHGEKLEGGGNYPTLKNLKKKYTAETFSALLKTGRRMMPAFQHLSDDERMALASFVLELEEQQKKTFVSQDKKVNPAEVPYNITGYNKFLTKENYPAIKPPWGTLSAVNLNTGKLEWQIPLGDHKDFVKKGIKTGTENYGGPVVTASGLLFIGATPDGKVRAFNKTSGKLLWEYQLPAPAFATPAMYSLNGKQYLVLACGGGKLGTKSGDSYVSFALPD